MNLKSGPPKDIDEYLARIPREKHDALEKLRQMVRAAAPDVTEAISYQIPVMKHRGRLLVGFGAAKNHCSFYVMSTSVMEAFRDKLESYDTSKGTIRFPAEKPLPVRLVASIVKARIAENEAGRKR